MFFFFLYGSGATRHLTLLPHSSPPRRSSDLSRHWRDGPAGALRMGVVHGAFCLGCCWFLMALLFYGGVMNLYWIAGLALFVLVEKTAPAGHRSEEHTSELQSLMRISYAVFCLKKNKN